MVEKAFPLKIGLEVHASLDTREKLFCMCRTASVEKTGKNREEKPNSRICPICTGYPGSKPMLPNKSAVEKLVQIGLVLGCKINFGKDLIWYRKHYNWADLPKGYQSTISGAHAVFPVFGGKFKGIKIRECHLEEDPAQWNPSNGKVNYNRSGLPLVEIVTDPDFSSSEEVVSWLKNLILSLSYVKAIRKDAGIKVDVNISTYGERAEIKNLNSIEKIRMAIEYEIAKQLENYENGIVQNRETLAFDEKLGKTILMRSKENAQDYRFVSDPDLPVVNFDEKFVRKIENGLPEMPEVKLKKLIGRYKLDKKDAEILTQNLELVEFVEGLSGEDIDVRKNISWITIELLRVLNYNKKTLEDEDVEIKPEHLAELISLVEEGKVTVLKAKQIMNDFVPKSFSVRENLGEMTSISDEAVENICEEVIEKNPHIVEQYKSGKDASLNFLMGLVMKESQRRARPEKVREVLKELIKQTG